MVTLLLVAWRGCCQLKTSGWMELKGFGVPGNEKCLHVFFFEHEQATNPSAIKRIHIKPSKWNFVGAICDQKSGRASLWINGKLHGRPIFLVRFNVKTSGIS